MPKCPGGSQAGRNHLLLVLASFYDMIYVIQHSPIENGCWKSTFHCSHLPAWKFPPHSPGLGSCPGGGSDMSRAWSIFQFFSGCLGKMGWRDQSISPENIIIIIIHQRISFICSGRHRLFLALIVPAPCK